MLHYSLYKIVEVHKTIQPGAKFYKLGHLNIAPEKPIAFLEKTDKYFGRALKLWQFTPRKFPQCN